MEINASFNPQPTLQVTNSPTSFDFHITTPRLYLSLPNPSNDSHCDLHTARMLSPSALKHNPSAASHPPDRDAARVWLAANAERTLKTGYGRFVVSLRTGGNEENEPNVPFSTRSFEHIGFVSMQLARLPNVAGPLIPDIGFNILPQYQGKGFASEAATHLMLWFRESKGLKAFAGLTDDDNEAAKKLFGRLGFRRWGPRKVSGITVQDGGKERVVSTWTVGVEESELEGLRL